MEVVLGKKPKQHPIRASGEVSAIKSTVRTDMLLNIEELGRREEKLASKTSVWFWMSLSMK